MRRVHIHVQVEDHNPLQVPLQAAIFHLAPQIANFKRQRTAWCTIVLLWPAKKPISKYLQRLHMKGLEQALLSPMSEKNGFQEKKGAGQTKGNHVCVRSRIDILH